MNETTNFPLTAAEAEELVELLRTEANTAFELGDSLILATYNTQAGLNQKARAESLTALADRLELAFPFTEEN